MNSFYRKDRGRRKSFLNSTTSAPKYGDNEYDGLRAEKEDDGKKRKVSSKKNSESENDFDSPFKQLYFQNFVMFLEELIKTEYPEKAKLYEESANDFELTIEEKNSQEFLK